jgi:SpoVK/Ycf46/Vps4 family AAA+-type ATPase
LRARLWARARGGEPTYHVEDAARRLRLTSGNIRRVAALAPGYAAIAGRETVSGDDLRKASSALNRQALDSLATLLPPAPDLRSLAVSEETWTELEHLVRRCRHRDELGSVLGTAFESQTSNGVRALFTGPSGTGKTFAARLLATELGIDLYRIDLAAVVDKYIGETEKHLGQVFAHAEELDVMLLLDEGDALLGERSAVHSATDRYANLETNYLLQRLETFDGILIVTTNAGDRIDRAFERRMDVVVTFQLPEATERAAIWRSHLPATREASDRVMDHIAHAYRLSGGQIRNAALHAGLLAHDDGGQMTATHLDAAIQREYRKLGRIAPKLDDGDVEGMARDG